MRALIARAPSAKAQVLLGKMLYYSKKFDAARDALKSVDVDDLDKYYGLEVYLVSLVRTSDADEALQAFADHHARLSEDQCARCIQVAAEVLYERGQAQQAALGLRGALKYDSGWDAAVLQIASCCWLSGDLRGAREILERALHAPCADVSHYMELARTYMYAEDAGERDLTMSFEIAVKGSEMFPDDANLWVQAGESAAFLNEGRSYFERAIALISAVPEGERSGRQRGILASALCNVGRVGEAQLEIEQALLMPGDGRLSFYRLLLRALIVTLQSGRVDSEIYELSRPVLESPVEQVETLRCHLIDLELYGRRGILANWDSVRGTAASCLGHARTAIV